MEANEIGPNLIEPGKSWSLRSRLLILLGGVVLLTLLLIAIGIFYFVSVTEQESWRERQSEVTGQASEIVRQFVGRHRDTLRLVSLVEPDHLATQPELVNDLLQQNADLFEIVRLDKNGQVVAGDYQDLPLLATLFTLQQSIWFRESQAGRTYLSEVQLSPASEPYLIISIPAPDGGVVAARVRMTVFRDAVTNLRFGRTGQAYVISREGTVVAHQEPTAMLAATSLAGRPEFEALRQAPNWTWSGSYINFKGEAVIGLTAPIAGTDWLIVMEISQAETTTISRTALLLLAGGLVLLGGLMVLVTGGFIGRLVLRPLAELRNGALRIGRGDLSHRIEIAQHNELGQLAGAFNQMTAELQGLYDNLENRVAQRTRHLEAVASLSEQLTPIVNLDELLRQVVQQIQSRFGYAQAQIFLLDQAQEKLVLMAASGRAGAAPEAPGHGISLLAQTSLVAQAARRKEVVPADHGSEPALGPANRLLPSTSAEMAAPILLDGNVVGVLAVQHDKMDGLDAADAGLLRTLANQVAAGFRNVQQFEQVQDALLRAQALQAKYLEQTWAKRRLRRFTTAQADIHLPGQALAVSGQRPTSPTTPVLTASIELHQMTIGQLELAAADPQRVLSEDELAVVDAVLDQVAQTAETLRLVEDVQQRAGRERLINEISANLRRAPDMETLLQTGIAELAKILNPARTFVHLGPEAELIEAWS
jgi:GAF domain-containing protein/HAMP domain-containing protein